VADEDGGQVEFAEDGQQQFLALGAEAGCGFIPGSLAETE
jgi:hypothetical protein